MSSAPAPVSASPSSTRPLTVLVLVTSPLRLPPNSTGPRIDSSSSYGKMSTPTCSAEIQPAVSPLPAPIPQPPPRSYQTTSPHLGPFISFTSARSNCPTTCSPTAVPLLTRITTWAWVWFFLPHLERGLGLAGFFHLCNLVRTRLPAPNLAPAGRASYPAVHEDSAAFSRIPLRSPHVPRAWSPSQVLSILPCRFPRVKASSLQIVRFVASLDFLHRQVRESISILAGVCPPKSKFQWSPPPKDPTAWYGYLAMHQSIIPASRGT